MTSYLKKLVVALGLFLALTGFGATSNATNGALQQPLPCPPELPEPLPPPPDCVSATTPVPSADLCLAMAASPSTTATPGQTITYRLTLRSLGPDTANNLRAHVTFDERHLELLGVRTSSPDLWVSTVADGGLSLVQARLPQSEEAAAEISLRVRADASPGAQLLAQAQATWRGTTASNPGISNALVVTLAGASTSADVVPLSISMANGGSGGLVVSSSAFAPREQVSLWYERQDRVNVALGRGRVDERGRLAQLLPSATLAWGHLRIVAQGLCSGVIAAGSISTAAPTAQTKIDGPTP